MVENIHEIIFGSFLFTQLNQNQHILCRLNFERLKKEKLILVLYKDKHKEIMIMKL